MRFATVLVAASLLVPSLRARADEQPQAKESYAGALVGGGIQTNAASGASSTFLTYSGRVGTGLASESAGILSLGLFVNHGSITSTAGAAQVTGSYWAILAELLDRKALGTGLYFGGRFGLGLSTATVESGGASASASASSFAVGPVAGYEVPIAPALNFDFDFTWQTIGGATFTFPSGTTVQGNALSALLYQGGLTYHW